LKRDSDAGGNVPAESSDEDDENRDDMDEGRENEDVQHRYTSVAGLREHRPFILVEPSRPLIYMDELKEGAPKD